MEIDFFAGDGSLNRQQEYLYTLFVPDRARFAFPCFDQPDLKARFRLDLELPDAWRAVANAPVEERKSANGRTAWSFAETKPLPTYLFSFATGRFEVEEKEVAGGSRTPRRMRLFHRETDAEKVAANRDKIFELHAAALDWLEE